MGIYSTITNGSQRYRAQQPSLAHATLINHDYILKLGVWVYFLLLIFEGALRKWFLPQLAGPLLIVRDPIALWLVAMMWQRGHLPSHPYLVGTVLIGVLGIFTATFLGHGNIAVALFGGRILLLHFPLMFAIGRIFDREDVIKIGKATLLLAIPMTVLIAFQFYSPQAALVNIGVGGDKAGAGFSGAMGFFRPPGTFSFTNGVTLFYSLVAPFVIYFWFYPKAINKLILVVATLGLLASIPLSISRSLFFSVGVTLVFTIIAVSRKPKYLGRTLQTALVIVIALAVLSQLSFFETASNAFTARFESANEIEGGVEGVFIDRYMGGLVGALFGSTDVPFWGYGLGMGTNAGSVLLTGSRAFLVSEGEWGRLIGELGPLMGIAIIFFRLGVSGKIAVAAYKKMVKGDFLPWMLLSFALLIIPQGQWAQPTALGFSTLIGGLVLASFRNIYNTSKRIHR